jgi:flavodoxin
MKSCVVYESMYGNTHAVAGAIAQALEHLGETTLGSVAEVAAPSVAEFDLVVVGGPTHVHGMSREATRRAAAEAAADDDTIDLDADAAGPGLRDWLDGLPKVDDVSCAAFDTRIDKPVLLVGSAARSIAKRLKRRGFAPVVEPESFFVDDSSGPLHDGELSRASEWGTKLSNEVLRIRRQRGAHFE